MAFKGAEKLHEEITVRDNVGRLFNRNKTHYVAAPLEMMPSLHKIGREKAVVQSPIVKNEAARAPTPPQKIKTPKPKKKTRKRKRERRETGETQKDASFAHRGYPHQAPVAPMA